MATPKDIVGDDWDELTISRMTRGLNTVDSAELIEETFFTRYNNVIPFEGRVKTDTGYVTFLAAVRGNPRKQFQHITRAGVGHLLMITNATLYRRVADQWQYVSNGTSTTVATTALTGATTTLNLASATGFATNDYIGVSRNDGTQYQGQITNLVGTVATISPAYSGVDSNVGNTVVKAPGFSGNDDNHVVAVTIPWSDECVFTNGVNAPQVYNPSAITVGNLSGLPSSGNTQCKSLAVYDGSLFLINTSEGGQDYPQRSRWSDRAATTVWTGGESGYVDFLDQPHQLKHALILGPYLYQYSTGSIRRTNAVNSATKRFSHDIMIANDGIFSTGGVVDLGDKHVFCGKSDFYEYRGGYDKVPIGSPIRNQVFGNKSQLDKTKTNRLFMLHLEERKEILVFAQRTSDGNPKLCFRYNAEYGSWGTRTFAEEITGWGTAVNAGAVVTWNTAVGSWANYSGSWNSSSLVGNNSSLFLLSATNDISYEYNFTSGSDNGSIIQGSVDTKDFSAPGWIMHADHIELKASGTDIYCYYSTDEGNIWTLLKVRDAYNNDSIADFISPGTLAIPVRVAMNKSFKKVRFRFESNNAFSIEWFKLRYRPEYEW